MSDADRNGQDQPSNKGLARWGWWADTAGKAAILLGLVATFAFNDKGGLLLLGLLLFLLLKTAMKTASAWLLVRSHSVESRVRRRSLVEAWIWTIILAGLVGGLILLMPPLLLE
jgi:hypothetical protein